METNTISLAELVTLLVAKSGLNKTELAERIGISRATLSNWTRGDVDKVDYKVRGKLSEAIDKNNWGFKLQEFSGQKVTIIMNDDLFKDIADDKLRSEITDLKDIITKLTKENLILREKISNYESKK